MHVAPQVNQGCDRIEMSERAAFPSELLSRFVPPDPVSQVEDEHAAAWMDLDLLFLNRDPHAVDLLIKLVLLSLLKDETVLSRKVVKHAGLVVRDA